MSRKSSDIANIREILNNISFFISPVLMHQLPPLLPFHNPRSLPIPIRSHLHRPTLLILYLNLLPSTYSALSLFNVHM